MEKFNQRHNNIKQKVEITTEALKEKFKEFLERKDLHKGKRYVKEVMTEENIKSVLIILKRHEGQSENPDADVALNLQSRHKKNEVVYFLKKLNLYDRFICFSCISCTLFFSYIYLFNIIYTFNCKKMQLNVRQTLRLSRISL